MMNRWEPFNDLRRMQSTMDRMWRRFGNLDGHSDDHDFEAWAVPLDVSRVGDDIVVRASMPGVPPQDIQVSIEDNLLTIQGRTSSQHEEAEGDYLMRERRSGSFHRTLRLPDSVDADRVQPRYEHGVLTVTVPKAEAKRARQLPVQVIEEAGSEGS